MNVIEALACIVVGYVVLDALIAWVMGKRGLDSTNVNFFDNRPIRRRYPNFVPRNPEFLFGLVVMLLWFGWGAEQLLKSFGWPIWFWPCIALNSAHARCVSGFLAAAAACVPHGQEARVDIRADRSLTQERKTEGAWWFTQLALTAMP